MSDAELPLSEQIRIALNSAEHVTKHVHPSFRTVRTTRQSLSALAANKRGQKWGGSKKGWRWKVSEEQIQEIRSMRMSDKKVMHIARVTGLSRPTIYAVLQVTCEAIPQEIE